MYDYSRARTGFWEGILPPVTEKKTSKQVKMSGAVKSNGEAGGHGSTAQQHNKNWVTV